MLTGEVVALRARLDGDISVLEAELANDVATRSRTDSRGLGTDTVRLLCRYGFEVRGMHRMQVETLADNAAMIRAATQAGFTREGTLRQAAWVTGEFVDEVILGQLASEWLA